MTQTEATALEQNSQIEMRSDNAATHLLDKHSDNAATQLANAQSERTECANAQSERKEVPVKAETPKIPVLSPDEGYAYFEGQIVPMSEAKVSVATHALHYGTACFEGIRKAYVATGTNSSNNCTCLNCVNIMSAWQIHGML